MEVQKYRLGILVPGNFSARRNLNSQLFQHAYKKPGPVIVINVRTEVVLEGRIEWWKDLGFWSSDFDSCLSGSRVLTCKVALMVIKVD